MKSTIAANNEAAEQQGTGERLFVTRDLHDDLVQIGVFHPG